MPHGFNVSNKNGIVQIDENYSNFEVTDSGITLSGADYSGGPPGQNLVFVRPVDLGVMVGQWGPYAGGQDGVGIWPPGNYFRLNVQAPANRSWHVKYMVATPSNHVSRPKDPYGFRVYTPSGGIAFDSNRNYLKIAGVVMASMTSATHTINLPQPAEGKQYYVLLNQLWITKVQTDCYGSECEDTNFGLMAEFVSNTHIRIHTKAWLNYEDFGSRSREMDDSHAPCVLIAEY